MFDAPAFLVTSSWLWLVLALASSLLTAQNVEANRRAKQDGFRMNFWRMTMAAGFWFPLSMLEKWPTDWLFYGAAMFGGVAMIIGFTIQNDLATKHNGRVAILHGPMKAVLVFLLWACVDQTAREHLLANPLVTLGVVGCLATMVLAMAQFRKNDVSWSSFRAVLPIVAVYGMGDILARLAIAPGLLQEQLVVFLFVVATTSAVVSMLIWPWRPNPQVPFLDKKLIQHSFRAALGSMANQVCFFIALVIGPSPAYVSMVCLLAPVWLLVYHRMAGIKDDANPIAGTLMVFAAIVLMVLVA